MELMAAFSLMDIPDKVCICHKESLLLFVVFDSVLLGSLPVTTVSTTG